MAAQHQAIRRPQPQHRLTWLRRKMGPVTDDHSTAAASQAGAAAAAVRGASSISGAASAAGEPTRSPATASQQLPARRQSDTHACIETQQGQDKHATNNKHKDRKSHSCRCASPAPPLAQARRQSGAPRSSAMPNRMCHTCQQAANSGTAGLAAVAQQQTRSQPGTVVTKQQVHQPWCYSSRVVPAVTQHAGHQQYTAGAGSSAGRGASSAEKSRHHSSTHKPAHMRATPGCRGQ